MLRTKIKEEVLASETVALAIEHAKKKVRDKRKLKDKFEEQFWNMLGRVNIIDSIQFFALVISIHAIISSTASFIDKARSYSGGIPLSSFQVFEFGVSMIFPKKEGNDMTNDELMIWIYSFAIAGYVWRHGMDILGAITKFFG
jgi:hypothetical protein